MTNQRIATLDAVRGLAVMGILMLNIVDMGLPAYAYVDPNHYGGAQGVNWWIWATVYVFVDGKMRGLFTMMFGASTVLIAERAVASGERPAHVHYARMASLFVLGMVHAYLIWSGDILVLYSLCGMVAFIMWRWRVRLLLFVFVLLMAIKLALGIASYSYLGALEQRVASNRASAADVVHWRDFSSAAAPLPEAAQQELTDYRGDWWTVTRARAAFTVVMQTQISLQSIPDTIALIALGMALFRTGFFSGGWSHHIYWRIVATGFLVAAPLYVPIVRWIDATHFSPVTLIATEAIHLTVLRPILSLAWAALAILFIQSGSARWLADRLAAVGRMAFSNYLGTSIVTTTLFYGYGFGWFGYLERWQLYCVVFAIWVAMLLWSQPWLAKFRFGPFEWLWRSLARWQLQPQRR